MSLPSAEHAVVLAAGQGRRLWPITATRPKPLVPVAGEPLLERLLRQLATAGIRSATIVAPEAEGAVATRARQAATDLGVELTVAVQEDQRGTGHALAQAGLPDAPTLVLNGDIFLGDDALPRLLEADAPTIAARRVEDVSGFGALATEEGELVGITEKPEQGQEGLVNAGVYVVPTGFQAHLDALEPSPRGELELTDAIETAMREGARFTVHPLEAWLDVGWPWDLLEANRLALEELEPAISGEVHPSATIEGPVRIEAGAQIRAGSVIEGPVHIGAEATVGPNAYVRPATTLGPASKVGHGCEVKNCVLMAGAKVPHVSYVGDSVLGRDVNLGAGTQVANLRHDGADLLVDTPRGRVDSGRRKLGVVLGDEVKTGINATLNCGVLLGPAETVEPGERVMRSRLPEKS